MTWQAIPRRTDQRRWEDARVWNDDDIWDDDGTYFFPVLPGADWAAQAKDVREWTVNG